MKNDRSLDQASWRRGEEGFVGGSREKARKKKKEIEDGRKGAARMITYD